MISTPIRSMRRSVALVCSLAVMLLLYPAGTSAQSGSIEIVSDASGKRLQVNGADFMINGMNWDYIPIGANYSFDLWNQSDDFIKAALESEMSLLKNMGVNAIRIYTGITPKWVTYIYEHYGIYTVLNHSFGRYGVTVNGAYMANTDYADPGVRETLLGEVTAMVKEFEHVPGLLMYLLGNENNYGLFWDGAASEDIPVEERKSTKRARPMYRLFNDAALAVKRIDTAHPVAMCNGDLLFIDIIAEECGDIDVFGSNMYRGISFRDAFEQVSKVLDKPFMITEFGSDAFNARENHEDQMTQARYLVENWREIYEQAGGMGRTGNSIGGFTFQFSDGWWKHGQTSDLDVHDTDASWSNGGYKTDYEEGQNNMNEEWFGICAKGPTDSRGLYQLYPRTAYYALQQAHRLNPCTGGCTAETIARQFDHIQLMDAFLTARRDRAALTGERVSRVRIKGLRSEFTTFSTGGKRITTPNTPVPGELTYPTSLGFDHMQSFYADIEAKPTEGLRGTVSLNVLGHVAENPIDEIFYENRGRSRLVTTDKEDLQLTSLNRVQVYRASVNWSSRWFDLHGFYRTGHYHWGYEGDFFGLYPEANYGPNIDIYNGNAPLGFEMQGKRLLNGLKAAFGPELWWGANPAVLLKYRQTVGRFTLTGMYHEDIAKQSAAVSSIAIPLPPTKRATIHVATTLGPFGIDLGGIWAGEPRIGELFQIVDGTSGNYHVYEDRITADDTWGAKVKFTYSGGRWNWYAQGAAMGLVAGGGADNTQTFTGWRLKDSGSGNQVNALTGFTYLIGNLQIAPNFLWQKPIEGPIPGDVPAPGRPRNILSDPFAVRANRETTAGELLLTYDPTPATWMYTWDNDRVEDAHFAMSAGVVYRHHPTTQDAGIGILKDGRTTFAFPGAPPARDLWEAHTRIVSKMNPRLGLIANLFAGNAEPNGDDERLIHRYGGDLRLVAGSVKLIALAKFNDWGPYDYHRDFNLTFPVQLTADMSVSVDKPDWFNLPQTRLGVRFTWRSLDRYSPRYDPNGLVIGSAAPIDNELLAGYGTGSEWEIRTYLHFNVGM